MKVTEREKYYLIKTKHYGKHYRAKTVLGASKRKLKTADQAVLYRQRFNDRYDRLIAALRPQEELRAENSEEK